MKDIYEKINDETIKIDDEIKDLNYKNKILNANKFEYKSINALAFAILPYIATVLGVNHLANIGIIPNEFVTTLSIGVPAIIGITSSGLLNKKNNINEKTNEFTSAKSYKDVLEEETLNDIEKKRLVSEKRILSDVKKNVYFYEQTMEKYESFDNDPRTEEEVLENLEKQENLVKENDKELKTVVTQNVLKDKFFRTRDKWQKVMKILIYGGAGAIGLCLVCNIPCLGLVNFSLSPLGFFAPVCIGGLAGAGFAIKREYDYKMVFNKINRTLGVNSLSMNARGDEKIYIKNLENTIRNRFMMRLKLEKEKMRLDSKKSKNTMNKSSRKREVVNTFDNVKENNFSLEDERQKTKSKVRTRRMNK